MRWMEQRCRELKPGKPLQVMYRLDGRRELPEALLKNFEGYKNSNTGAHRQRRVRDNCNWTFMAN